MDNKKSCNSNIQCTVNSCAYHNPQNYCSLSQVKVGCTERLPLQLSGDRVCLL